MTINTIGNSSSAWSYGVQGVQAGVSLLDSSAATIARQSMTGSESSSGQPSGTTPSTSPPGDLSSALVRQKEGLYAVKANVMVLRIADQTVGSLLHAVA